jgi:hypothetical protein
VTRQAARRLTVAALALAVVPAALLGCSRDETPDSDAERFCGEAKAHTDLIVSPPLGTEAELAATLDFYRLMGDLAPLAIAAEWADLVHNLETAAALEPGDAASEQHVAMTAYATEPSAYAVKVWLQRNCGVDIPITTIAPQAPVPARTIPPPSVAGSVAPTTLAP